MSRPIYVFFAAAVPSALLPAVAQPPSPKSIHNKHVILIGVLVGFFGVLVFVFCLIFLVLITLRKGKKKESRLPDNLSYRNPETVSYTAYKDRNTVVTRSENGSNSRSGRDTFRNRAVSVSVQCQHQCLS